MSNEPGRRLDWSLGILTFAAILGSAQGRRIALIVEDVSFVIVLVLVVVFVAMAWWRVVRAWKNRETARWKVWMSLAGCVALSVAFGLPCIPFFGSLVMGMGFGPRWDYKMLMFGFGLAALLAGIFSAKRVGFPMILGGLIIAIVGLLLPVGV